MDAEQVRQMLLPLAHVTETMQWGNNLVFWAGGKALGGKMFALVDLDYRGGPVIAFAAGAERFSELREIEGFGPAPYLARAHWIAAERWDVLTPRLWEEELRASYELVLGKLPKSTRAKLALPKAEQVKLMRQLRRARPTAAASRTAPPTSKLIR